MSEEKDLPIPFAKDPSADGSAAKPQTDPAPSLPVPISVPAPPPPAPVVAVPRPLRVVQGHSIHDLARVPQVEPVSTVGVILLIAATVIALTCWVPLVATGMPALLGLGATLLLLGVAAGLLVRRWRGVPILLSILSLGVAAGGNWRLTQRNQPAGTEAKGILDLLPLRPPKPLTIEDRLTQAAVDVEQARSKLGKATAVVEQALAQRPDYQSAKAAADQAETDVRVARLNFPPASPELSFTSQRWIDAKSRLQKIKAEALAGDAAVFAAQKELDLASAELRSLKIEPPKPRPKTR